MKKLSINAIIAVIFYHSVILASEDSSKAFVELVTNGTITRATEAPAMEVSIPLPTDDLELNAAIEAIGQEKQYYDASESSCIPSGQVCEIMIAKRVCCSGRQCQLFPSPIIQVLTMGGWGICH